MKVAWLSGKRWEKIETYIMVTAITMLVWLYAEAETVKLQPMSMEVAFSTPSTHFIVDPAPPMERISVNFRCTSGQLENIQQLKDRGPLKIELEPESRDRQTIAVDLRTRLSSLHDIERYAVTVESTTPDKIAVEVEGLVTKDQMPIRIDAGNVTLPEEPKAEPPVVTVIMPASIAAALPTDTLLMARLDEKQLNALEPGPHEFPVPVVLPPVLHDKHVRVEPARVTVTFTITSRTSELTYRAPLFILGPPADLAEYEVIPTERFVSINLIGPPDTMEQIESGQLREQVYAELRVPREKLDDAAASGDETDHSATFRLPPGVRASPPQQLVTFKVDRRAAVEEDAE